MEQQSSFQRHESTKNFSWPAEVTAIALSLAGGAFLGTEVMKLNKSKHEPIQNSVSQRTGSITCVGGVTLAQGNVSQPPRTITCDDGVTLVQGSDGKYTINISSKAPAP